MKLPGNSSEVMVGILNWNQKEDTLKCLDSLRRVEDPALHIVLVDNGSSDGSVAAVKSDYPEVVILANHTNRGCAGGRNDLLKYFLATKLPYLIFLDNDAMVRPDTIARLVQEIKASPDIGVLGLRAYYDDRPNVFWSRGGACLDPGTGKFTGLGQKEEDRGQYACMEEVDSVPGGFTFLKREVAEKVPVMDERYFIYYEDSDWCMRVKKAGFRIFTSANASVSHRVSASLGMESPRFYYYRTRNRFLFMRENAPEHFRLFSKYFFYSELPRRMRTLFLSRQYRQMWGCLLGVYDFWKGSWYVCGRKSLGA